MRIIRFRGKRIDGKGFAFGSLILPNSDNENTYIQGWNGAKFKVIPETVCQFTGLHDKNGKEIYEGDFITYSGITSNGQKIIRVVNYNYDYARFQGGMYPLSETKNLIEVIGNIYENPELLEK